MGVGVVREMRIWSHFSLEIGNGIGTTTNVSLRTTYRLRMDSLDDSSDVSIGHRAFRSTLNSHCLCENFELKVLRRQGSN